jgi:hypothetical protein
MKRSVSLVVPQARLVCVLAPLLLFGSLLPVLGQLSGDTRPGQSFPRAGADGLKGSVTVQRTEEGQRGNELTPLQRAFRYSFLPVDVGLDFVSMLEFQANEEIFLGGTAFRAAFLSDLLGPDPNPANIDFLQFGFEVVSPALWQNAVANLATEGGTDVVAGFSYSEDGTQAGTMKVRLIAFDQDSTELFQVTVADNVATFAGDPFFSRTGLAVDNQGRSTLAYSELFMGTTPRVLARRVDMAGTILDATPIVVNNAAVDPSAALLDPAGNRVVIVSTDFANIKGNVLDSTGGTPTVGPQFQISTTPGQFVFLPSVASNPVTGEFLVVWEHLTGATGNPQNVRARRFDANGNPVGPDFQVNTQDANAQGQPTAAFGPNGESVVVWAGDSPELDGTLDVFFQAYDANGDPIGGEQRANSSLTGHQDRPVVSFLPGTDSQGNAEFAIYWRDVGNPNGSLPNGTGTSYARFSIAGPPSPNIFADGFESGDTSSWSSTVP